MDGSEEKNKDLENTVDKTSPSEGEKVESVPEVAPEQEGDDEKEAEPVVETETVGEEVVPKKSEEKPKRVLFLNGSDDKFNKRILEKLKELDLDFIFLNDTENSRKTLDRKCQEFGDIPFAIIVLSGDLMAFKKDLKPADAVLEIDSKVTLEMGYWIRHLGRENIFIVYRELRNFRLPTGFFELAYHEIDKNDKWLSELVSKLKSCGYL